MSKDHSCACLGTTLKNLSDSEHFSESKHDMQEVLLVHEAETDVITGATTTRRTSLVQVPETDRDQVYLNSYRKLLKKSPKAFSKQKG